MAEEQQQIYNNPIEEIESEDVPSDPVSNRIQVPQTTEQTEGDIHIMFTEEEE